ncbi:pyridoxamine 5'-phosphate oxidase family protein [Halobellus ordinarius]|uniref:pyridoxamine 5'-phosphate oxidase family protein n=1 Tax=Halobellus ordinarius TaxID=3075120 RepID=UPI0028802A80|nr:pyridoxamine 5'-phosphate oxidase family protein [Halobellus sp. ZY16]
MPRDNESVVLDRTEIDELLGRGGVGVLALAGDNDPYAIPISYGYDAEAGDVYLRLGFGTDSEKREYVEQSERAVVVVTVEGDRGWQSVVVRGPLSEISEASIDGTIVEAIRSIDIPFFTITEEPVQELDYQLYRLQPDEVTGRREKPPAGIE